MKKIETLLQAAYISEVASTAQALWQAAQNSVPETDVYLSQILDNIHSNNTQIVEAINRSKIVSELEAADAKRDDAVRAIFYLTKGYTFYPTAEVANAAIEVSLILDKYGLKTIRESFAQETAHIDSLAKDLENAPAIVQLLPGVPELITQLTEVQNAFVARFIAYKATKAQEETYQNAGNLKTLLLEEINTKLITYLQAMQMANPDAYGSYSATASQIIEGMNTTIRMR